MTSTQQGSGSAVTAEPTGPVISAEMRTSATPEQVWRAWADPEKLSQWFVDAARGSGEAGGTLTWVWSEFGVEAPYDVLESVPGERLVLAAPPHVSPPGLIVITIAREAGETRVTVVNSGFMDPAQPDQPMPAEVLDAIRSGWTLALVLLREYLERHYGIAKRSFLEMRDGRFTFDSIRSWFLDEAMLSRWLTRAGSPAGEGEDFTLVLWDGTRLDARTLAITAHEVAFAVPSEDAVYELKAFPAGLRNNVVAVRRTSWGAPELFETRRAAMAQALGRLVAQLS